MPQSAAAVIDLGELRLRQTARETPEPLPAPAPRPRRLAVLLPAWAVA